MVLPNIHKTNIHGRIYNTLRFKDMGEVQDFIKNDTEENWYCAYTCPIMHDMFFVHQEDRGTLAVEVAIEYSKKEVIWFGKFVKTASGYYIDNSDKQHNTIHPKDEKPISAGFIGIINGKEFSLRNEWSSTLKMGRDDEDFEGLAKFLGLPGTKEY